MPIELQGLSRSGVRLRVVEERFPVAGIFTISRGSRTEIRVVTVELWDGRLCGRGECVPYERYGESVEGVINDILALEQDLFEGLDRTGLQSRLAAGAARNAVDCALWDLEAKRTVIVPWKEAKIPPPRPLNTAYTLSLATPESMRSAAKQNAHRPLLKVKLGSDGDLRRIEAVRSGAPEAILIVDANEAWTLEQYMELAPRLLCLGVAMVEQPLPADADEPLRAVKRILPVCADESCHDRSSLEGLVGKYDAVNIKLDKAGGLTEALELKRAALARGFEVMVGCMLGTSLAMAPAFFLAQNVKWVDLDAPLLLARDRDHPIIYSGSRMNAPSGLLWG